MTLGTETGLLIGQLNNGFAFHVRVFLGRKKDTCPCFDLSETTFRGHDKIAKFWDKFKPILTDSLAKVRCSYSSLLHL